MARTFLTNPITNDSAVGGKIIDGSTIFDSQSSTYLSRTPSSAGDRRTWTWSGWVKRAHANTNMNLFSVRESASARTIIRITDGLDFLDDDINFRLKTDAKFRDTASWYHFVVVSNTTDSTSSNRLKVYVNGEQITSFSTETYPSQNYEGQINTTNQHALGREGSTDNDYLDGYMAEIHFVDGSALTPSSFGYTEFQTTVWRPKKYTGSHGTNGFYLPLDGSSHIGVDQSGNGNNFTSHGRGISVSLDKATGALPIMKTNTGGSLAVMGEREDPFKANLVLAIPFNGANFAGTNVDRSASIKGSGTQKTVSYTGISYERSEHINYYSRSASFDGSNDFATVGSHADFGFGTGDFTIEFWVSRYNTNATQYIIDSRTSGDTTGWWFYLDNSGGGAFGNTGGLSHAVPNISSNGANAYNNWYHIAIVQESGVNKLYRDGELVSSTSNSYNYPTKGLFIGQRYSANERLNGYLSDLRIYKGVAKYTSNFLVGSPHPRVSPDSPSGVAIERKLDVDLIEKGSVMFNTDSSYIQHTNNSAFSLGTTWTIEFFFFPVTTGNSKPIGTRGDSSPAGWEIVYWNGGQIGIEQYGSNNTGGQQRGTNTLLLPGQWYHVAITYDGTNAKTYIDGALDLTYNQSGSDWSNGNHALRIGRPEGGAEIGSYMMSNVRIVKGTVVYSANFTPPTEPLTNISNTVLLCCQSPTNPTEAAVIPGSFTSNAVSATTHNPFDITDVINHESNFAIMSALNGDTSTSTSFPFGGTVFKTRSNAANVGSSIAVNSGKWYGEFVCTEKNSVNMGVSVASLRGFDGERQGNESQHGGYGYYYVNNGTLYLPSGNQSGRQAWDIGDVIGVALDMDNHKVNFYLNNSPQGEYSISSDYDYYVMAAGGGQSSKYQVFDVNFGQKAFRFLPPKGHKGLSLSNISTPIIRPQKHFDILLYTGTDASAARTVTGLEFAPDLVWQKRRNGTNWHTWHDTVRGGGKTLYSNSNNAEATNNQYGYISAFTSDGFTWSPGSSNNSDGNEGSGTFVSWCWKGGGAAVSNSDGSITSSVSANTEAGFSVVGYTGTGSNATVGHGLGSAPQFIITKQRSTAGHHWRTYHKSVGATRSLYLDLNNAQSGTDAGFMNNTEPTSTVFSIGNDTNINENSQTHIAYCWTEIPGFSKIGKYTGNGNANGPFVYCGFRPALILHKDANSTEQWQIKDTARDTSNPVDVYIHPNLSNAENTSTNVSIDFLSNGFKIRNSDGSHNTSGNTYVYVAFAEQPQSTSFGTQSNAR